jgi:uncharacterized protein YjlB
MSLTIEKHQVEKYYITDDGFFPNNQLPVLFYKKVLHLPTLFPAKSVKDLFAANGWTNPWEDGVFEYHHYHSITHEVLGCYSGKTTLLLGGDRGIQIKFEAGDVLIIPAGVAHKNLGNEDDVKCIGAYPDGMTYDMNYGRYHERPQTDRNIKRVPIPTKDPVFGDLGDLQTFWKLL